MNNFSHTHINGAKNGFEMVIAGKDLSLKTQTAATAQSADLRWMDQQSHSV